RQEPECGEVGDVGRVTDHVARGAERPYVLAQTCTTVGVLGGRDRVSHFVPPFHAESGHCPGKQPSCGLARLDYVTVAARARRPARLPFTPADDRTASR